MDNFVNLTVAAGAFAADCVAELNGRVTGKRIPRGLVDATARHGYSVVGAKPRNPHEIASEYYQVCDVHSSSLTGPAPKRETLTNIFSLIGNLDRLQSKGTLAVTTPLVSSDSES